MSSSKILVAGGAGFIGKHVCAELDAQSFDFEVIDLKDGQDICYTQFDPGYWHAIILLAADLGRDHAMYRHNLRIYEWLARQAGTHVVYASSAAVYADGAPSMERQTPTAPTLYGASKLLGETILKATQESWTILRLANVFGDGEGNGAIDLFKAGGNKIYGSGLDVRDYVSVKTVAKAFVLAATEPERFKHETYNISSGVPMTTLEAFKQYGKGSPVHLPARDFDTKYSLLINTKAVDAGLIA